MTDRHKISHKIILERVTKETVPLQIYYWHPRSEGKKIVAIVSSSEKKNSNW